MAQSPLSPSSYKALLISLIVLCIGCSYTHPKQALCDEFFQTLQLGKTEQAYTEILSARSTPTTQSQLNGFVSATNTQFRTFGKIEGVHYQGTTQLATGVHRLSYVLHQEKAPSLWNLYFYQQGSNWYLIDIEIKNKASEFNQS